MFATALGRTFVCGTVAFLCATPATAQRLPLTTFTMSEGMAGNDVMAALEDPQGFLWLGTERGLSRYDGREFRNFGKDDGLSDERVTSLVTAPDGGLWVGTWSGVFRFRFEGGGRFSAVAVEGQSRPWERTRLVLDGAGTLWCAADGLYRLERSDERDVLRRVAIPPNVELPSVSAIAFDATGNLWLSHQHTYRRRPDGAFERIPNAPIGISALATDMRGRIWATAVGGFWIIDGCPGTAASCRARRIVEDEVLPWVGPVWKSNGGAWLGTATGLLSLDDDDRVVGRITRQHGLLPGGPAPLLLDRRGDLWIAIGYTGLQRLVADGMTSFGAGEGIEAGLINSILTTRDDDLVVFGHPHVLHRLDRDRFTATRPRMPGGVKGPGWGWYQIELQDRFGEWWISTENGVARWPAVARPEHLARTPARELLAWRGCFRGQSIFRLYEDSRADLWIGTIETGHRSLYRWNRASGTIDCFSSAAFLGRETAPTAFLDDGNGTLWIGFYQGQIARYRDGRFTCLVDCTNPSQGNVTAMLLDRRRRLWIATMRAGVLRIDDLTSDTPRIVRFTSSDSLTSNRTRAVLEDRFGRMYVGTDVGIDVLDGDGRRMRHYGVGDGLPHPFINMAQADRRGNLWFGTLDGLARLEPRAVTAPAVEPRVLIDGIRVAGTPRGVAVSGEQTIDGVELGPDQRNLEVDFVALPRSAAGSLRFQYRLSDGEVWSPASASRLIVLAGLSAGSHRLQIRAIDAGGRASAQGATVSFRVLAPLYRRGWFLGLAAVVTIALATLAYRARVAHLTALERQRTRIAMDLHDEMGSRLGSIGLLADVAAEEAGAGTPQRTRLEHIAETAAELGSSLGDIVWSLRRGAMTVESVAQHLTVHGRRLFPGAHPVFHTRFPERWPVAPMSLATGRAVLLIGLEALHNCARHAQARMVTLDLHPEGREWVLEISDDGEGMPADVRDGTGFGMETMRRRAAQIGASLVLESFPHHGTSLRLGFNPRATERPRHQMNIRSTAGTA